jgi:hypothetical protein
LRELSSTLFPTSTIIVPPLSNVPPYTFEPLTF